jgi:molybdopterin adenylyltransferase
MGHIDHKASAPAVAHCYVLTVSDTRTEATDASGQTIIDLLWAEGHQVMGRRLVRDEPEELRAAIAEQLDHPEVQVIITNGGTGIASRDTTVEVVEALLEKRLDGFGELFRMLSYHEIGSAAMMSRACAGVARRKIILSLPGSENAVRLGMTRLILPELGHLLHEVGR